jgi:hypothetical protein
MTKNTNQKGFMALTSIIIVSAITLAIAVSISLLGVGEARNSLDFKKGQSTLLSAEGCIEEALIRLKLDEGYPGGSLNVGDGACNISVSGTGADRTIDVAAQTTNGSTYLKRIQVTIRRAGTAVNITGWSETP